MGKIIWGLADHFVTGVAAYALALALIALLITLMKKLGWRRPVDAVEFVSDCLRETVNGRGTQTVNIEYRGSDAQTLDFGPFVKASVRTGQGRTRELHEGVFCDCDPEVFNVGALCVVSVQAGIVKERVTVQLDRERKVLFVQSRYNQEQLLAALIGEY